MRKLFQIIDAQTEENIELLEVECKNEDDAIAVGELLVEIYQDPDLTDETREELLSQSGIERVFVEEVRVTFNESEEED